MMSKLDPVLTFGSVGVRLLNVPCTDVVAQEVFEQDCYELDLIPEGAIVLDVGAFYGEFALRCAIEKRCDVIAYEPCKANREILALNVSINDFTEQFGSAALYRSSGTRRSFVYVRPMAVGASCGPRTFLSRPEHPAGSMLASEAAKYDLAGVASEVDCTTLAAEAAWTTAGQDGRPLVVKLDCEGAEHEIFSDLAWLERVSVLVMEWHNRDGAHFRDVLEANGFAASIAGSGPKPRPTWEPGMAGGLLWAVRR